MSFQEKVDIKVHIDGLTLEKRRNYACFHLFFEKRIKNKMSDRDVKSLYRGESTEII